MMPVMCVECDGNCGVCEALKPPRRPDPLTDTSRWTLRGNAFHTTTQTD